MIDIIIPCYNAHNTLKKPLDSIAKQTIKDKINVLLVDDCSDEGYESFVEKYQDQFKISVLRLKENSGPGIAREEGIKHTKGEYITFIDSDDYFIEPTSIEDMYNYIITGYDLVKSIEYDQKKRGKYLLNGNLHGKMYKRDFIEKKDIHFNASRFHEDNYFNNFVNLSGPRVINIASCTYYYTYNKKSITNADPEEVNRLEIYMENYRDIYEMSKHREFINAKLCQFLKAKYGYLRKLYLKSSDKDKKRIKEIVKKYDQYGYSLLDLNYYFFHKYRDQYIDLLLNK